MSKPFYIFILFIVSAVGCTHQSKFKKLIPARPIGWVSDFEENFSKEQVKILDGIIAKHESESTNQIGIVTIHLDTVSIKSENEFEQFTLQLFNQWGIGQKEKKNGVAIFFQAT